MHYDQKRDIQQAIHQALTLNPFAADQAELRASFHSYLENALEEDSLHHYMGWSVDYLVMAASCHAEDTCAEEQFHLTEAQEDALYRLSEEAWKNGAWVKYPKARQSAIAWAIAGADEPYAKAIQEYMDRVWSQFQKFGQGIL